LDFSSAPACILLGVLPIYDLKRKIKTKNLKPKHREQGMHFLFIKYLNNEDIPSQSQPPQHRTWRIITVDS
jgi:hypothetical protein